MMSIHKAFLESTHLRMQANHLIFCTLPLQRQILNCKSELTTLIGSENVATQKARMSDLRDEIFGCDIEIQVLRFRARKLVKQAKNLYCTQKA